MSRRGPVAFALVATTLLLPPTAATGLEGVPPADELGTARDELADAERSLTELQAAVRHAGDEVAMLDARLTAASTDLARTEDELAAARLALVDARAHERDAAGRLQRIDDALERSLTDWETQRSRLQDRAILTYKHGRTGRHDLLVAGIAGAGDWHDVAVTLETADRIAADERGLVDVSVELSHATSELRAEAGEVRREALRAERSAVTEEQRVTDLLAEQGRIVADIDTEHGRRAAVLAELEADADARAVLVHDLQQRVEELQLAATRALVPVQVDLDVHGPAPAWADRLPAQGRQYAPAIDAIAARHGVDGRLMAALVWAESGFRADAVSHAGALGLAQLMPGTARGLGVDPRDPLQNLDGGTRYLRAQLDRFGSVDLALAAYNAGPGRVARAGGVPNIVETQLYVVRVLDLYEQLSR